MEADSNRRMYDNVLLGILQNEGKIEPFLDVVFGFLYNCTDFFRIRKNLNDKCGFLPEAAQKIAINAFRKYEKLAAEKEKSTRGFLSDVSKPAEIEEIESTDETSPNLDIQPPSHKPVTSEPPIAEEEEELDDDAKKLKEEQKLYQDNSESYNGAIRDTYTWSQNIQEVDVHVQVPDDIIRGKQVKVDFSHTHLSVGIIENNENKILMEGDLSWKVNVENSCWTLRPGQAVHVNLEKVQERWWDSLLIDEPKINIRNIDASRPMNDLADDEQAKIHELMYNQQQKQLGKVTSEQM
uniref:CS domain-containing protein n=1 Tax=Strigamia maritima TaxID=126957 RepID=T1JKP9_STRMM